MQFSLALLLAGALGASAKSQPQGPAPTVGERLAADLQWTQPERDSRFAHMDRLFPTHTVRRGGTVRALPSGRSLLPSGEIAAWMQQEHLAGILVVVDGTVREEDYRLGLAPHARWTSFSMTKAVTDTLAGVALHRGRIHSLEDNVAASLPEMRGSAYDGVSIRQLITMTSSVAWNESYTSPDADNVRLYTTPFATGKSATVEYMRQLHRSAPPGSRWQYNTGETDLLGVLLRRVTGQTLADQLSFAVWKGAGMEDDATWIASASGPEGQEFGGSGLSATLRDFGRLALWVMEGGAGQVPAGWFNEATRPQVQAGGTAYGYGWWPQTGGSFAALGIFGQSMLIDPQRKLVIVTLGDWNEATGVEHSRLRAAFWKRVQDAVDREQAKPGSLR